MPLIPSQFVIERTDVQLKGYLFIALGFLLLLLGAVGVLVPILPTTPFVLLASGCFAYGSPRLSAWLEHSKYFGEFIRNYKTKTGVGKSTKIKALLFLYCTLGLSFFLTSSLHLRLLLLVVAVGVSIHIFMIKTKK